MANFSIIYFRQTKVDSRPPGSGHPQGSGALFGLIFDSELGVVFVDDATNTLDVLP
jgi:hypothetical protein